MMTIVRRVLPEIPYTDLKGYVADGGGAGWRAARAVTADVVVGEVEASGLRGRGGAGFPTGAKWRTVCDYASNVLATSVVVNAAEGEPGTFKDRAILRANPYAVLEGALIAARVVGARSITVATKERFHDDLGDLRRAIGEIAAAGWSEGVSIEVVEGPGEYLYGEETALLEVLDGRPPLPRIAPPWRRGVVEVVAADDDVDSDSGLAADVVMATTDEANVVPPVLVNNVETLANVPSIVARGAAWFREVGTEQSPGTIVCTVTGAVRRPGVYEVAMGTTLADLLACAGGTPQGRSVRAVLNGVSNSVLTAAQLDVSLTYEGMQAAGSGLGSASFMVAGDDVDPIALAAGVSRFLAVESCGQCTPCKVDGLQISARLGELSANNASADDVATVRACLGTVADGARCNLARQHQIVVGGLLDCYPDAVEAHVNATAAPVSAALVAELVSLEDGVADFDEQFLGKQPDWTFAESDSGQTPVDRLGEHRAEPPAGDDQATSR